MPSLDRTFAECDAALATAKVIEERQPRPAQAKELVLFVDGARALHVVIVVEHDQPEPARTKSIP